MLVQILHLTSEFIITKAITAPEFVITNATLFMYSNNKSLTVFFFFQFIIRNATRDQVLEALCHVPENIVPEAEVIVAVLSFIVALDEAELDLVKKLLESPVTSWCRLLAHVKTGALTMCILRFSYAYVCSFIC